MGAKGEIIVKKIVKKVAIIGAGAIAKRLKERLKSQGDEVCFSLRRNSTQSLKDLLPFHDLDAVFLAISTLDRGEAARDYIFACAEADIPIITCEKGALAYHAKVLQPCSSLIGCSASVGGGTGILNYIRGRNPNNQPMNISVVLNGTLNFILDEMQGRGRTLGEACGEASKLGIAEPGNDGPQGLINGELIDVGRKVCVFFNTVIATNEFLTPNHLGAFTLTRDEVQELSEDGADYRMLASFSNHPSAVVKAEHQSSEFLGPSFKIMIDGWTILAGFRKVANRSEFKSWLPSGVGNALHIVEGEFGKGGKYTLVGPGAGAEPTTSAMLNDFDQLCPP